MEHSELIAMLRAATVHPYQLGFELPGGAIAPAPENCVSLTAGPIEFVVESRTLDDDAAGTSSTDGESQGLFDDYGPTLHVMGTNDRVEHLRFDCFAKEPHYHYFRAADHSQVLRRIDQYAEGDPAVWAFGRVRDRLPEMLDFCGQVTLADSVRSHSKVIARVMGQVEPLLRAARDRARIAYATAR